MFFSHVGIWRFNDENLITGFDVIYEDLTTFFVPHPVTEAADFNQFYIPLICGAHQACIL